jgi:eukaryotic-like serine/threonine-protein kinase
MAAPSELTGLHLGHYRVRDLVGAGGMGVVYRAFDERLNRAVALKILHPNAPQDDGRRKRFRKEALLLSSVNHPNIASIFDFDTHDGVDFIVMEFVSGVRLSDRIAEGPLPESEASYLGQQILSALSEAHSHGIVHQDLKPGNIMVGSNQHLKVLDFGLAKVFESGESAATESLPQLKECGGTLPYMAPESLRGNAVDRRADIWSFGVVLYEMASGARPFRGHTTFEISSAILGSDPPKLPGTLSSGFRALVSRCLIKEPGGRFQTAGEAAAALKSCNTEPQGHRIFGLRWVAMALALLAIVMFGFGFWKMKGRNEKPSLPNTKQLAILPLGDSTGPEMLAFGAGLNDTLTTRLTGLTSRHDLQVIPASEIRSKKVTTLQEATQEFGVNLGLEIGVHRSGEMVRVNYILVDAKTHRQLRGDTITAPASDPFTLEDRVSDSILNALELELRPEERRTRDSYGTAAPAAYDYFLQGRGYLQEFQKPESIDNAIEAFGEALQLDPSYAMAHAGLGESYWQKYELTHDVSFVERATAACKSAVQLQDALADGYVCLGTVLKGTGQYAMAARAFAKASDLDPTSDDALVGIASVYERLGQPNQAEDVYRRAIVLRPQYWRNYNLLGAFYANRSDYSKATEMFAKVISLAPDSFRGYSNLAAIYILEGRYDDATNALEKSIAIRKTGGALSNLGTAYFHLRRFDEAAKAYNEAIDFDKNNYSLWGNLAAAYYYGGHQVDSKAPYSTAINLASERLAVNSTDAAVLADRAAYYSMLGSKIEALRDLKLALRLSPKDPEVLFGAAQVYDQFGDEKAAMDWVRRAVQAGCSRAEIRDSPAMDNLRNDPEFQSLVSTSVTTQR